MTENNIINDAFEQAFLELPFDQHVRNCDHYELAPVFEARLPDKQPVLEAGCGSGRWVAWFVNHGWRADGLDWSETLCERAAQLVPDASFYAGDMRNMPLDNASYGSIVSLGAVEHTPEGPHASLREYFRVLRPGGIAIITVPYLSPLRKITRLIKTPVRALKRSDVIRKISGRPVATKGSWKRAKESVDIHWEADFAYGPSGWEFFQYNFSKRQMQQFLTETGFEIVREFVDFGDEGVFHNLGRATGQYDSVNGRVAFNWFGRICRTVIPLDGMGHMLCYIVRKPEA